MERTPAQLVGEIFEAVGRRGDIEPALASAAATIEWDMSGVAGWPEEPVYRGRPAVRGFLEAWRASWEEWHFDTERLVDLGDSVFVAIREWGVGARSGASVEQRRFFVWTVENGRTVLVRMFSDEHAAVEAAGMRR